MRVTHDDSLGWRVICTNHLCKCVYVHARMRANQTYFVNYLIMTNTKLILFAENMTDLLDPYDS